MSRTYVFIRKFYKKPRQPEVYVEREEVLDVINKLTALDPLPIHFDLETVGLSAEDPNRLITNIGIASEIFLIGISFINLTIKETQPLWDWMAKCQLSGFNLPFDMSWPWGAKIPFKQIWFDTSIAFRYLATEGLKSQPHTLEIAIEEVLAWPEDMMQKEWLKEALATHSITKEEMWKLAYLTANEYTYYSALDAEASYQLEECFQVLIDEYGPWDWEEYMHEILPHKIYRIIEGQYGGVGIDRELALKWGKSVVVAAHKLEQEILEHPEVAPLIEEWTHLEIEKQYEVKISEGREMAKLSDAPWLYPKIWRFEPASPDKKLPKWCEPLGGVFYKSVSKVSVKGATKEFPKFNFNSTINMKWLIYDRWLGEDGYEFVANKKGWVTAVKVWLDGEEYEVPATEAGSAPTGGDILSLFGEVGKNINDYKKMMKMFGEFIDKFYRASERDGAIHPTLKIYGAQTGRGSGG